LVGREPLLGYTRFGSLPRALPPRGTVIGLTLGVHFATHFVSEIPRFSRRLPQAEPLLGTYQNVAAPENCRPF
jgi:hypothetical protein